MGPLLTTSEHRAKRIAWRSSEPAGSGPHRSHKQAYGSSIRLGKVTIELLWFRRFQLRRCSPTSPRRSEEGSLDHEDHRIAHAEADSIIGTIVLKQTLENIGPFGPNPVRW